MKEDSYCAYLRELLTASGAEAGEVNAPAASLVGRSVARGLEPMTRAQFNDLIDEHVYMGDA
jgi:hypothetical protein